MSGRARRDLMAFAGRRIGRWLFSPPLTRVYPGVSAWPCAAIAWAEAASSTSFSVPEILRVQPFFTRIQPAVDRFAGCRGCSWHATSLPTQWDAPRSEAASSLGCPVYRA